jgi:hypothetical protein
MVFPELKLRFDLSRGSFCILHCIGLVFLRLSSRKDQIKFVEYLLLSGQNIFSSRLLSKSVQIKIQRTIVLPTDLHGRVLSLLNDRRTAIKNIQEQGSEEHIWN